MSSAITSAYSYTTPWTARLYDALPGSHFRIGFALAGFLLAAFIAGRIIFDGAATSTPREFRLAIVHILFAAYAASAYAYLLFSARRTANELAPVIGHTTQSRAIIDLAGRHPWWALALAGVAMNLAVVPITIQTTTSGLNPWGWEGFNYDIGWHRALGMIFNWWIGGFLYVLVTESARLSRLSQSIESLDLADLHAYQPFVRQGLTNALLVFGMVAMLSLFLVEPGYAVMMAGAWTTFVIFAWIGLMLPLRGIREQIRIAKERELAWCRGALKIARDKLKSGDPGQQSITEIIAYQSTIENIRNWPFDNPTLGRFALYLLIPLGSWLGAAFVERGLDLFLP